MAATIPAHAVIASFSFEDGASNALHKLKNITKAQELGVRNAAVLKVGDDSKLRIQETSDMSGGKGMVVGGVVGGVVGLLGSTVLLPLGIGAAVGGLASKLRDSGFPNQRLKEVGDKLKPGDSLLIVAVDDGAVDVVSRILKDAGADLIREAVDGKVVEELETEAAAIVVAGAVEVSGVKDCPEGYPIKGNADSLIYHVTASPVYAATLPEVCFATEEDAVAAGYRPPLHQPR